MVDTVIRIFDSRDLRGAGRYYRRRGRLILMLCLAGLWFGAAVSQASPLVSLGGSNPGSSAFLLGERAVGRNVDSNKPGWAQAFPARARTAGVVTAVSVYVDSRSRAKSILVGLYAGAGGRPGARSTAGSLRSPKRRAWNTVHVPPTRVKAGTTYWIAAVGRGGTFYFRDSTGAGCRGLDSRRSTMQSLPSNWRGGARRNACRISAYASGTVAEAAPVNPGLPPNQGFPLDTGPPANTVLPVDAGPANTAPPANTPPPVDPAAPANTALPVISGQALQGQTLSTSDGSWTNNPSSYSYQWRSCDTGGAGCSNIAGATSAQYTPGAADVGHTLRVIVTAGNAGGTASATSAATGTVAQTGSSVLLGDQTVESQQDGGTGTSEAFGYTASVTGSATSISVYLTSTSGVSLGLYADSWGQRGARLDGGPGGRNPAGWVPAPLSQGVNITAGSRYWLAIAASSNTATVSYRDRGSGGSNLDYSGMGLADPYVITAQWNSNPASVYLSGTPAPPSPPSNTSPPAISGTPRQGDTLTASNGNWSGTAPMSFAYQWQRCTTGCTDISGATSSTYTVQASDVGDTINVVVTATNSAGSASATSAAVGPATAAPPPPQNTAPPLISGEAAQGQTLST